MLYRLKCRSRQSLVCSHLAITISCFSLAATTLWAPQGAYAEEDARLIEEVVVTASKRGEQRAMDVPVSVQAFSGDDLSRRLVRDFTDIAVSVPSVQIQDRGPGDREFIIRGINSAGPSTVGVYYDEAVVSASNSEDGGGRNAPIQLYDMQRVEVLRGPQGTLYGANSMAGVVRYVTNKPNLQTTESYINVEGSGTKDGEENVNVNGMFNLPIVENKLGLRFVGWHTDMGGYIDAIRIPAGALDNVNDEKTKGARVQLRWSPVDQLRITLSQTVQSMEVGGSSRFTPGESFALDEIGFPAVQGGDLKNVDLVQSPWEESLRISSITAEYDTQFGSFLATSNYFFRDLTFQFDNSSFLAANPPFQQIFGAPFVGTQPVEREVYSNEFRFSSDFQGPFQLVAGIFYQEDKTDWEAKAVLANSSGMPVAPFTPGTEDDAISGDGNTVFGRIDLSDIEQFSVFTEATLTVFEDIELLAGVRYFDSEIDSTGFTTHNIGGGPGVFEPTRGKGESDEVTTKFTVSWTPRDDLLLYVTRSEGFRRGGVNNPAGLPLDNLNVPESYDPDTLTNWELGAKSTVFQGSLQFEATLFSVEWDDLQLEGVDDQGITSFIDNFGSAEVDGIEFSATFRPANISGLTVTLGGSVQDAELSEDTPAAVDSTNSGRKGDGIPNVPDFQAFGVVDYRRPAFRDYDLEVHADFTYRDDTQTAFNDQLPTNMALDNFIVVDAAVGINNGKWNIRLFAENLFDERAEVDATPMSSIFQPAFLTVRPRTIGVSLTRRL